MEKAGWDRERESTNPCLALEQLSFEADPFEELASPRWKETFQPHCTDKRLAGIGAWTSEDIL